MASPRPALVDPKRRCSARPDCLLDHALTGKNAGKSVASRPICAEPSRKAQSILSSSGQNSPTRSNRRINSAHQGNQVRRCSSESRDNSRLSRRLPRQARSLNHSALLHIFAPVARPEAGQHLIADRAAAGREIVEIGGGAEKLGPVAGPRPRPRAGRSRRRRRGPSRCGRRAGSGGRRSTTSAPGLASVAPAPRGRPSA